MSRVPIRLTSPSKYRAKRTEGYASKKEAKRAAELKLLEEVGVIAGLKEQPSFLLVPQDAMGRAVTYRADFSYTAIPTGEYIVEDVKGFKTPVYRLKRRLMLRIHGIEVREV